MKKSFSLGAALALASAAGADPVIGNLTTTLSTGTNLGVKAAGFRMPNGAAFQLDGVTIATIDFTGQPEHPRFAIFEGATAPTTLVTRLRVPDATNTGWMTLVAPTPVVLREGRTYWVVGEFGGGGDFNWGQNPDVVPSGLATHVGYLFNGTPSSVENSYELQGTWAGSCINFDVLPGADRYLGTGDDTAIVAPTLFVNQAAQLTTDFMTQGIVFTPNPGQNDRNEILNNDTFSGGPFGSEPNLLTSAFLVDGNIQATFLRPVYRIEATIGLAGTADTLEAFDSGGNLIAAQTGFRQRVVLESGRPIARMRVRPSAGVATTGIDDLCFGFLPPASCSADLTGSSDPNDPAYGVPDGVIDASDFFYYLDRFVTPCP